MYWVCYFFNFGRTIYSPCFSKRIENENIKKLKLNNVGNNIGCLPEVSLYSVAFKSLSR